jgi:hypothetical protein
MTPTSTVSAIEGMAWRAAPTALGAIALALLVID